MPLPKPESGIVPVDAETQARNRKERGARVTTILLIGKLISRHGEALCRIRNLSSGGLMTQAHVELMENEPVQIELKAGDRLSGRVRWTEAGCMGIAFDQPVEVGSLLARAAMRNAVQGRVRGPRFAVRCPADLRSEGRRHAVHLVNLSQGGARMEADCALERDQLVTLAVPGLPERQGGVRWSHDGTLGIAFVEPLAFEELGPWLAEKEGDGDTLPPPPGG